MTSREPTPDLRITLLEERVADFSWALERISEITVEMAGIALARQILSRVAAESEMRTAQRCVDSTPHCE